MHSAFGSRAADAHTGCNIIVADPRVCGQQNLRPLELARRLLAAAQKRREFAAFGLAQFDPIAYIHPCLLLVRGTDEQLNRMAGVSHAAKNFTPKQGQYLAFIHLYTRLHRQPGRNRHAGIFSRQPAFSSPNGADARTRGVHQKATKGRPQHRSAR